jgi:hypothetical protein
MGCEKPEPLYPKPILPIGIQSQTFAMGETYENQLWFDFATQKTETNAFGLWHIGFSCDNNAYIILNGGINANTSVATFNNADFGNINSDSLINAKWKFDHPNGQKDSTAFSSPWTKQGSNWIAQKKIYVIDLGAQIKDSSRYVKLRARDLIQGQGYQIEFGSINSAIPQKSAIIPINTDKNFVYYNFIQQAIIDNEPMNKMDWDIVFTTYKESIADVTGIFYNYVIRGVLINTHKVEVAQLDNTDFASLTLSDVGAIKFTKKQNEIGYDWKQYDQSSDQYTMVPKRVYVIKTNGLIYKMKFVDFYNDQGKKGYPKLAWELLN